MNKRDKMKKRTWAETDLGQGPKNRSAGRQIGLGRATANGWATNSAQLGSPQWPDDLDRWI